MCDNLTNLLTNYNGNGGGLVSLEIFSKVMGTQLLTYSNDSSKLAKNAKIKNVKAKNGLLNKGTTTKIKKKFRQ